jgi:hypothetical protein
MRTFEQEIKIGKADLVIAYDETEIEYIPGEPPGWNYPGASAEVYLLSAKVVNEDGSTRPANPVEIDFCQWDNDFYNQMLENAEACIYDLEMERAACAAEARYESLLEADWSLV